MKSPQNNFLGTGTFFGGPASVSLTTALSPEVGLSSADDLALNLRGLLAGQTNHNNPQSVPHPQGSNQRVVTSVLLNTRNHGRFIEACVESLLAQTVPADEIVAYDDQSSDDTVARLCRFGERITLLTGGDQAFPSYQRQANAVLTAFARSRGDLVFLLDGDDRFRPEKIEQYCAAFERCRDASMIQAPMEKIDDQGRTLGSNCEARKHVQHHLTEIYRQQDVDFYYPTSSLAFSRSYLHSVLPLNFSDGIPLWSDTRLGIMAPYYGPVLTLPHPLTEWRRHADSDSIRARGRNLQIQQTLMRTEVFNAFCRKYGLRTISAWRNARFYKQLLRLSLPELAYDLFYRHVRSPASPVQPDR